MFKKISGSILLFTVLASVLAVSVMAEKDQVMTPDEAQKLIAQGGAVESIPKSVWKQILTPEQYDILWQKGTERPYTGALLENKQTGVYVTAGCRIPVFSSEHKYKSGTGWPSFWEVFDKDSVVLKQDWSMGIPRTEVLSKCGEHLGHVFKDGPAPTGLRYCINSEALTFVGGEEADLFKPAHTKVSAN